VNVGRVAGNELQLEHPSVSKIHAALVMNREGTLLVADTGSTNGTFINGRRISYGEARQIEDGDVVSFGAARCRMGGIPREDVDPDVELRRAVAPDLTRREVDVLTSLCRPALSDEAFVAPATAREIATDLVVTEAAVKQHLLRLYQKFRIPEGANRRTRLANEVIALGLVRPLPPVHVPPQGGRTPETARRTEGPRPGGGPGAVGGAPGSSGTPRQPGARRPTAPGRRAAAS
jgi:hypothetical protein